MSPFSERVRLCVGTVTRGFRLVPERLVVVGDHELFGRTEVRRVARRRQNESRAIDSFLDLEIGDLVVHVRHEFPTADAPFFAPGSDGAQIHPKVRAADGEPVVLKHHVNAFRETDLKALLDRHGVEEVVICGAMSHMCIDAGVRAASDLGYRCTVLHDARATRDQEFAGTTIPAADVHAAYMAALHFAYAKVMSTEEYLRGHSP